MKPTNTTPTWLDAARSHKAILVLETAHPPSFYTPWADVNRALLQPRRGSSFCEWRGQAKDRQPNSWGESLMAVNTSAAPALRSASGESCPASGGL